MNGVMKHQQILTLNKIGDVLFWKVGVSLQNRVDYEVGPV